MSETKMCPNCKVAMEEKSKGYGMGSPLSFHRVHVDIYECPKCGLVELYSADVDLVKCPVCGHMHHPNERCVVCALNEVPGANEIS